jgi:Ca2+-binding RTX toxin-like protein
LTSFSSSNKAAAVYILAIGAVSAIIMLSGIGQAIAALINGTSGNDELNGTQEDDFLYGKDGDDRIFSGGGNNVLGGDNGDDELYGNIGSDRLYGGLGNDKIFDLAADEVDYFVGGPGDDFLSDGESATNGGVVFMYGSEGNDILRTQYLESRTDVTVIMVGDAGSDLMASTANGIMWGGPDGDAMYASASMAMYGDDGDDHMFGSNHGDLINGGLGDDELTGSGGADTFACGDGNDSITDFDASEGDLQLGDCESY